MMLTKLVGMIFLTTEEYSNYLQLFHILKKEGVFKVEYCI